VVVFRFFQKMVSVRLFIKSLPDHIFQFFICGSAADDFSQIPSGGVLQACFQITLGGKTDTVALPAELMAHRADESQLSRETFRLVISAGSVPQSFPLIGRKLSETGFQKVPEFVLDRKSTRLNSSHVS